MKTPSKTTRGWHDDPLVYLAAFVTIAAHAWMFYVGRYLPYIDWSNHLGLISILAHGEETGALAYANRSFAPTPYWLFYMVTGAFAQVVSVESAAKLTFLTASGFMPIGAAYLAHATGRSPRIGLIAPLAMFGYSLGYGFGSFVCSLPLALFSLGAVERLLIAARADAPLRRRVAVLACFLALTYLGHALILLFVLVLAAVRISLFLIGAAIQRPRRAARIVGAVGVALLPMILVALPALLSVTGWRETGAQASGGWFEYKPRTHTLASVGAHLLERGSAAHWRTMQLVVWLWFGLLLVSIFRGRRDRAGFGLEIYATCAVLLYAFGPNSIERPMQVWAIYSRFATLAALLTFMVPRTKLSGWVGGVIASLAVGLVVENARVNRATIERFNQYASRYDPVRQRIPKHARVLALTLAPAGDLARVHPAMGSLYFYHLADGAAYVAFLFDTPMHPVHPKKEGRPRVPFWRSIQSFDPATHGQDYDYLVLRGAPLVQRAKEGGLHDLVDDVSGWVIFKTKNPTPNRAEAYVRERQ